MTARNFLPLHLHSLCARGCTSSWFRTVFFFIVFAYRLDWSVPVTISYDATAHVSSCAHGISGGAPFLIILVFCRYNSVIIRRIRGNKNTHWNAIYNPSIYLYINKGSLGSTVVVGAWVACEHAKQQLATICVTIYLSAFCLSFASTRAEWHLIFIIIIFLFDVACVYKFHIRFGSARSAVIDTIRPIELEPIRIISRTKCKMSLTKSIDGRLDKLGVAADFNMQGVRQYRFLLISLL